MDQIMTERFYVAIGGHGWGKGLSAAEAKREARRHCRRGVRLTVYKLPAGAHSVRVSGMGDLRWQFQVGADTEARPELVEDKGKPVAGPTIQCPECGSENLDRDGDCLSCGWERDDDGVADWQGHVAKQKAQRASAEEQGA